MHKKYPKINNGVAKNCIRTYRSTTVSLVTVVTIIVWVITTHIIIITHVRLEVAVTTHHTENKPIRQNI